MKTPSKKKYPLKGGDKRSPEARKLIEQRTQKIVELRLKNYPFAEIAKRVGGVTTAGACNVFWAYVRTLPSQDAENLRREMSERLRLINRTLWNHFDKRPDRVAEVMVHVEDRFAKLNGLDKPIRTEVSGPEGGPIALSLDLFAELRRRYELSIQKPADSNGNQNQEPKKFPIFPVSTSGS